MGYKQVDCKAGYGRTQREISTDDKENRIEPDEA
jgi:hypothetical protein